MKAVLSLATVTPSIERMWRRPQTAGVAGWAFLEPPRQPVPHPAMPLQPARSIAIGLVAGLTAGIALPWVRIPLSQADLQQMGLAGSEFFFSMMLTAILVQAAVAVLTVFAVARLTVIHAMFAAFVAGNVLSLALCAQFTVHDPNWETALFWLRLGYGGVVTGGAAAAFPLAVVAWVIKSGFGRIGPRPER